MSGNGKPSLRVENGNPSFLGENLADFLTLSRGIIGLVILSFSFIGKDAYITVVILALIAGATDIFDGKAARRYLGENRKSKLCKYDVEVDTFFVLCVIGYLSFSEIVIPTVIGLGWIGFALAAVALSRRNLKILLLIEIPSVVVLLAIAGLYNLETFVLIILPAMAIGIIINRKRVLYLIFEYWPKVFSH